ncbi:flagellar brake protein [Trinickia terrae]|nr:flagellar brake protein [Trinickia terrae]
MERSAKDLSRNDVPVGTALEWPIVDETGTLLLDSGTTIASTEDADFLFAHFRPRRQEPEDPKAQQPAQGDEPAEPGPTRPATLDEMHLTIGSLLGVRSRAGSSAMQPSRLIGFSPNHTLFVTPPLVNGNPVKLMVGETVDIVAIASQAVFRFACTVEALCNHPFDYVVLSAPGAMRRLRERKAIRIRARLPVRYAAIEAGDSNGGLGLATGISASGMSLMAPRALGTIGERLHVSFQLRSKELDARVDIAAVIRNVHSAAKGEAAVTHGLEFEALETAQQLALKSFVFDRQEDAEYWTGGR